MKLVFATNNINKLKEVNEIAKNSGVEFILPPDGFNPEENGQTFEENSYIKAYEAAKLSGQTALADDSGLCVDSLNGAPGLYSARYAPTQQQRIERLLKELSGKDNRNAKFVCCMTLVTPDGETLFQTTGICNGHITDKPDGVNGFGYDPVFIPDNYNITIARMDDSTKNSISHRGNALRQVLEFLSTTNL